MRAQRPLFTLLLLFAGLKRVFANTHPAYRNGGGALTPQGTQALLTSIDARLRNLEQRLADDDRVHEQILRRIDALYERMHLRVYHIEMAMDAHERRIKEQLEHITESVLRCQNEDVNAFRIRHLEAIVNATRYEQQNAMRSLVVLVGRLEGKRFSAVDVTEDDRQQFAHIERTLDVLAEQQAAFADGCTRIQSDEPQLEAKIGELLEKIVDVFQRESSIDANEIQRVEKLLEAHDVRMRRRLLDVALPPGHIFDEEDVAQAIQDLRENAHCTHIAFESMRRCANIAAHRQMATPDDDVAPRLTSANDT